MAQARVRILRQGCCQELSATNSQTEKTCMVQVHQNQLTRQVQDPQVGSNKLVRNVIQWLQQGLGSFYGVVTEDCRQQMVERRRRCTVQMHQNQPTRQVQDPQVGSNKLVQKEEQQLIFPKNLLPTPETFPNPTLKDYKETQVMPEGGCQYMRLRRSNVCIVMA